MTPFEAYPEYAAIADAIAWLESLDDYDKVDLFEDRGPMQDRYEDWLQHGEQEARDRLRGDDAADRTVVIRGADLAFLAADADPTPPHGIERPEDAA